MTAEELAELLRDAHPDAEPSEIDPLVLDVWVQRLGADPQDDALISQTLVAWERLIV